MQRTRYQWLAKIKHNGIQRTRDHWLAKIIHNGIQRTRDHWLAKIKHNGIQRTRDYWLAKIKHKGKQKTKYQLSNIIGKELSTLACRSNIMEYKRLALKIHNGIQRTKYHWLAKIIHNGA